MKEKTREAEGDDELRAEYPTDLIRSGVRGKYAAQRAKSYDDTFDLAEALAVLQRTPRGPRRPPPRPPHRLDRRRRGPRHLEPPMRSSAT